MKKNKGPKMKNTNAEPKDGLKQTKLPFNQNKNRKFILD